MSLQGRDVCSALGHKEGPLRLTLCSLHGAGFTASTERSPNDCRARPLQHAEKHVIDSKALLAALISEASSLGPVWGLPKPAEPGHRELMLFGVRTARRLREGGGGSGLKVSGIVQAWRFHILV